MNRIRKSDLDHVCRIINKETGSPLEPWTMTEGNPTANIGNYHLSGAYGGWQLQRTMSDGGGVEAITPGYLPKRDLYGRMVAYLDGIRAAK